ncbi:DUF885 domain-containing protein [Kibdelosporangium phytohabitans]|uniref:DUF885 domain-containing protein n=1 Tax=Kibdelosporangium phytohabitans TaxID=860235 RepID=UPI000B046F5B|nr:DUF885 domain-containing protein [Kibdelosporangium phytohabitans]MBE1471562.1 uncharacterized protein (DUF885 family) [Kibdelosporangium phytohabitans]
MTDPIDGVADRLLDLIGAEDPLEASLSGIPGHDHELRDLSQEADAQLRDRAVRVAAEAELAPAGVTRSVILQLAASLVDKLNAGLTDHVIANFFTAPAIRLATYIPRVVPTSEQAERDYVRRLSEIPRYLVQAADRNRAAIADQRFPVARMAHAAIEHIDRYLNQSPDTFAQPSLTDGLRVERDRVLRDAVRPAFAQYREILRDEVAPHARPDDKPGLCWLPDGDAAYDAMVRVHTTTARTPEQLHRTGLELIEALAEEYASIGSRVFGVGTAAEVQERLRTDHSLRWGNADEIITHARATISRAEGVAPQWFARLPEKRCLVEKVPDAEAPGAAGAYYTSPALDGSREGTYWANTYKATERDRYSAESIAFHEAVPGHHFQIAFAQQLTDLHLLRRLASITAYAEGWALYAERLADEMGLFSDDLARLGMLAEDSMRAARLVVDTGLHAMGWTREQTVEYLRANTVMTEVDIQSETDRYIEDPGQALAYMVGRLEFQRVRGHAEQELGDRFDIKEFHDLVLSGGALPMPVLDEVVTDWITRVATNSPA